MDNKAKNIVEFIGISKISPLFCMKSPKENNDYETRLKNLGIISVDFKGFDFRISHAITKQLEVMILMYPEVLNNLKWLSTDESLANDAINRLYSNKIDEIVKCNGVSKKSAIKSIHNTANIKMLPENVYAKSIYNDFECSEYSGILFNKYVVKNYNRLLKWLKLDSKIRFTFVGGDTIEGLILHEVGHLLYKYIYEHSDIKQIFDEELINMYYKSNEKIVAELGTYSSKNIKEFYAEAFCKYHCKDIEKGYFSEMIGLRTDRAIETIRKKYERR